MRALFITVPLLFLSACAETSINWDSTDPQAIAGMITIEHDEFKKTTRFVGPDCVGGKYDDILQIVAIKPDGEHDVIYVIKVYDQYNGNSFRYYDTVYDSSGKQLKISLSDRKLAGCTSSTCVYSETFILDITRYYLEQNQTSGLRFEVSGRGGKEIFYVPSNYIKAILSVVK